MTLPTGEPNMDSPEALTLAGRVEAAQGPNFELERDIHEALYGDTLRKFGYRRDGAGWLTAAPPFAGAERLSPPPAYTASVDAALALVAEKLPGHDWGIDNRGTHAFIQEPDRSHAWHGNAATPALALLAAMLRALAADEGREG